MRADTLANAERAGQRDPGPAPPAADYQAPEYVEPGPVGATVARWRSRALAAEAVVERLRRELGRYRMRP